MLILFIKHSFPVFSAYNKKLPERTGRTLIREKTLKTAPVKTHSHLTVPGMKNKAFSSAPRPQRIRQLFGISGQRPADES